MVFNLVVSRLSVSVVADWTSEIEFPVITSGLPNDFIEQGTPSEYTHFSLDIQIKTHHANMRKPLASQTLFNGIID